MAVALKVDGESSGPSWSSDSRIATEVHGLPRDRSVSRVGRGPGRTLFAAAFAFSLLFASDGVEAMGLGAASVQSGLGQPLRMSFPVSVQPDEEVGCVQVRAKGDDLPAVLNTRTAVVRTSFQTRIEIRSLQPVDEPAIGIVITVGCASPISREYVIFLDPPVIAPTTAAVSDGSRALPPVRTERTQPVRRAPVVAGPSASPDGKPKVRKTPPPVTPRAPRTRPPVAAATVPAEAPQGSSRPAGTAPASPVAAPASPRGDRLTVVPTEPAVPGTPTSQAGPSTAPVATPPVVAPAPAEPSSVPATPAPVTTPTIDTGEVAAREQALRQQQTDLQLQVKALSDQIAALKVQTTSLATRNQALEQSGFSSTLIWLLVLLAVLAILVAAWMAWRYTQLRRSIEGAAWWTGNTAMAAPDGERSIAAETRGGVVALDPGTRLAPRPPEPDVAPIVPSKVSVSNVEGQRPGAPRPQRYPAPIDTDFTVSDIEAAMATVRTVSPPRATPRPPALDDSDFAPLGGPTLPSPFTDPPPPPRAVPPVRAIEVIEHEADDLGKFVDIDIPPLASPRPGSSTGGGSKQAATALTGRFADDETEPLDFKLDIPHSFDPLATDSMKTTIVDRANQPQPMDFDLNDPSNSLDFEFPSATQIVALTNADPNAYGEPSVRHGATALDDLFAPQREPGIDTILDLDERDGSPLSTTEVDRLTTTAIDGPNGERIVPSTRALLARFADLMNQVDDVEGNDPLRAIALLRQYVLRDEKIPTLLWLRLFELYRKVDKKPVYEALAEHFARRYNRPMVGWTQTLSDRVPQTPLSAMGPIDREIESLWGKDEGLERIRSLLCDRDRDDAVVFNAVLQRDLLDAAKVFPAGADSHVGGDAAGT